MRVILYPLFFFLLSCEQHSSKEKVAATRDSIAHKPDSTPKPEPVKTFNKDEIAINKSLHAIPDSQLHVLNDKTARWMKDAFDYFILPKRKSQPNYPYVAIGDFNADGKSDTAALVRDSVKNQYRLAILIAGKEITFWDEDILDDAAIQTLVKPGEIQGMDERNIEKSKVVRPKGDVIEIVYFEKASFVIYWVKNSFKRIQTSD